MVALRPWGSAFFRLVAEHAEVFTALPAALHEALVRAYIAGAAHRPLSVEHADLLAAPWLGPVGQAALYRQMAQIEPRHTDEVEPLYPGLDLPVLVVWGEHDEWIPVDRAHRLAALIPGARLHLVPRGRAPRPAGRAGGADRCPAALAAHRGRVTRGAADARPYRAAVLAVVLIGVLS